MTRTDWFKNAKWGVFMHFLATPPSSIGGGDLDADTWNRQVDGFDVDGLARQLHEIQAGYFYIALGQNSGHYCSPNPTYDAITGVRPSKCARRDLVLDLYNALARYDIPLLVYLPSHAPMSDVAATKALGYVAPWDFGLWSPTAGTYRPEDAEAGNDERLSRGQRNWEAVIRDWSLRWGNRVRGWWFDGCYYADRMYRHPDAPNFKSFGAAARAGNPDSIVAWNCGVYYPIRAMDADEDYTAGEVEEPERVDPPGPRVKQDQFHVLSFLGTAWGSTPTVRFTPEEAVAHTRAVTDFDGVFTWDTPFTAAGQIRADAFAVLKAVGAALAAARTAPSPRPVTVAATLAVPPVLTAGSQTAAGTITLRLGNPWDTSIAGRVSLHSAALEFPGGSVQEYALALGEAVSRTIPVGIRGAAGPCFKFTVNRPGVRPSTYPLP
ncbi:MAG: hypothetical protein WC708_15870, partial [Lentisphaeria bacterium]